jgi:hypothetical protein
MRDSVQRSTRRKGRSVFLMLGWMISSVGCDAAFLVEAPVQLCTEAGVQCQLAKGPLGVCERATCEDAEAEPCFVCTPQH